MTQLGEIFPERLLHLGGDEVIFDCWKESAEVAAFMREKSIGSYEELEAYYFQRLFDITDRVLPNRTLVVYQVCTSSRLLVLTACLQDVFDNGECLSGKVGFRGQGGFR